MEFEERVTWLQKNYQDYPKSWYYESPTRTNAIFLKRYKQYIADINQDLKERQKAAIDLRRTLCEEEYKEEYGVTMEEDINTHGRKFVIVRVINLKDSTYTNIEIP